MTVDQLTLIVKTYESRILVLESKLVILQAQFLQRYA